MSVPPRVALDNPFAESLAHISPHPPRSARELPGLQFKSGIMGMLFPLLPFVFICLIMPLLMMVDPDVRASRIALKNAPGQILSIGPSSSGPPRPPNSQNSSGPAVPARSSAVPTPTPQYPAAGAPNSLTLQFRFKSPDGKTYYGETPVWPSSTFARLKPGAPITIAYDPADPSFNGLAGVFGKKDFPFELFLIFPLFFLCLLGPILLTPLWPVWQARGIFSKGEIATGRVIFVTPARGFWPSYSAAFTPRSKVTFTFTTNAGAIVHGAQICDNQWLLGKLDPGSEITVVYLPKAPRKSIFLEPFIG